MLCQSMTIRTPFRLSAQRVTMSVGNAGGFWTSTRSGRGSRRSVVQSRKLIRAASTSATGA